MPLMVPMPIAGDTICVTWWVGVMVPAIVVKRVVELTISIDHAPYGANLVFVNPEIFETISAETAVSAILGCGKAWRAGALETWMAGGGDDAGLTCIISRTAGHRRFQYRSTNDAPLLCLQRSERGSLSDRMKHRQS